MKKTPVIIVAVIAIVVALGAIIVAGGNDNSTDSMDSMQTGSSNNAMASETAQASADAVATTTVAIADFKFGPQDIKVKVGDTVTWTNNDTVRHNVAGVDNELPVGELMGKGETYTYTFTKAGVFNYICSPHPYMMGSVTVE